MSFFNSRLYFYSLISVFAATALAGCASTTSVPQSPGNTADNLWRAVPESDPTLRAETSPTQPSTPALRNSAETQLVNSDLPVMEPLRAPLEVNPTVAELGASPAARDVGAQTDSGLAVVELREEAAQIQDQRLQQVAMAESNAAAEETPVSPVRKPEIEVVVESEPLPITSRAKAVAKNPQPEPKVETPVVVAAEEAVSEEEVVVEEAPSERQIDPEPAVSVAQATPSAETSDVELMCTEVISGVTIGTDACAILNRSVEGLGFAPGSAELTDSAKTVLDSVAEVLRKKTNLTVSVATFSNDLEDTALGELLARRRTLAVIRHIISNGVEGVRVRPHQSTAASENEDDAQSSDYLVVLRSVAQ